MPHTPPAPFPGTGNLSAPQPVYNPAVLKRSLLRPAVVATVTLQLLAGIALAQSAGDDASDRSAAEFGRGSGPALQLLTKSQQKWSGSLGLTLSKSSSPLLSDTGRRAAATLGGTVIQDRLWFFGSAEQSKGFDFTQFAPASPAAATENTRALAARIDSQLGARQSLSASFTSLRSNSPLLNPLSTVPLPASSLSLRYSAAISPNMFFNASVIERKGQAGGN